MVRGMPKFKCPRCHKALGETELYQLSGNIVIEPDGFLYSTAKNYCKKCYKELTGEVLAKKK